jgi:hypothetical protein
VQGKRSCSWVCCIADRKLKQTTKSQSSFISCVQCSCECFLKMRHEGARTPYLLRVLFTYHHKRRRRLFVWSTEATGTICSVGAPADARWFDGNTGRGQLIGVRGQLHDRPGPHFRCCCRRRIEFCSGWWAEPDCRPYRSSAGPNSPSSSSFVSTMRAAGFFSRAASPLRSPRSLEGPHHRG